MVSTVLFVIVTLGLSFEMYLYERENGPPYDSYVTTLKAVLPILIISGMDVERHPTSAGALLCSYLIMISGLTYIAVITAAITTEFVLSRIKRGPTMRRIKFQNHILICGWTDGSREVLNQLFAPDLKEHSPLVIIDPDIDEPPMDHPMLKIVQGDPADSTVLKHANAEHAKAAILLSDREGEDPNAADARNLLIALAVETFQPNIYSCVEVLNPDNIVHFQRANVDEVISVSEISNYLVVQAALNPGLSTMITDILRFGEGEEAYGVPVPEAFVGKTFADLSSALMRERGMVLIGVNSEGVLVRSHRSRWQFKQGDTVFVLAENQPMGLANLQPEASDESPQQPDPNQASPP